MRERTTWDRPTIAKMAGTNRKAEDPRAMNQDHLSQQPSADKYTTGGPSEFGEDVHPSSDTWKAEYKGDETDRNEIGMPNFRSDSFKTASLAKKAVLCVKIAQALLKNASEEMIEDQSLDFMHLSDAALIDTANRLAGIVSAKDASDDEDDEDEEPESEQAQAKQAKDASDDDSEDEKKDDEAQAKQAGKVPPQFLENMKKKQDEAKDDDKDDDKDQKKEAASLARQAARAVRANDKAAATKFVAALATKVANDQAQQLLAQAMRDEQQMAQQQDPGMFAQQQVDQMMAQMQQGQPQQQMAQQGQPQQQMAQQGQPQQQQAQCQDDSYLLDQMLQDDPAQQVFASDDIQMEGSQMDLGDAVLSDADDALRSLFAHSEEYQNAIKAAEYQGLPVPAPASANTRTASTSSRTIGTRPSKGVPQLGGTPVSGGGSSEVDNISSLWRTDPDVSNVFR